MITMDFSRFDKDGEIESREFNSIGAFNIWFERNWEKMRFIHLGHK